MRSLIMQTLLALLCSLALLCAANPVSLANDDDANYDYCGIPSWGTSTLNQYTGRVANFGTGECNGTGIYSYYFHPTSVNIVNFTVTNPLTGFEFDIISNGPSYECVLGYPTDGGLLDISMRCFEPNEECEFQYGDTFDCMPFVSDLTRCSLQSISPPVCENLVPEAFTSIGYFSTDITAFNSTWYLSNQILIADGTTVDDQVLYSSPIGVYYWTGETNKASYVYDGASNPETLRITQNFKGRSCQLSYVCNN